MFSNKSITLAHSPDSDDAFMFYALTHNKIDRCALTFSHKLYDIEKLNRYAKKGIYDVTAISFHAYPAIYKHYALLTCGASVGDKYGPIVVAKKPLKMSELRNKTIAIPGTLTTAFLVLKLFERNFRHKIVPFNKILETVANGIVDAGILIHEGQLNYTDYKLKKVIDLGEKWFRETSLPLPLGGVAVKMGLGNKLITQIASCIKASIQYALSHREEALSYAKKYARNLDFARTNRFIGMYVNDYTIDIGREGKKAVELLLRKGFEAGIIKKLVKLDWID